MTAGPRSEPAMRLGRDTSKSSTSLRAVCALRVLAGCEELAEDLPDCAKRSRAEDHREPGEDSRPETDERSAMSTTAKKRKQQKNQGFTAEEKAAMRARARELKAAEDGESAVRAALAAMAPSDRAIGKRLHALVKESAPDLTPKTWYGMPAYANKDGKVVCFFRNATKFKERYAMFGFNDSAKLDDGSMWPIAFALKKLTKADEARIAKLVKQAVS